MRHPHNVITETKLWDIAVIGGGGRLGHWRLPVNVREGSPRSLARCGLRGRQRSVFPRIPWRNFVYRLVVQAGARPRADYACARVWRVPYAVHWNDFRVQTRPITVWLAQLSQYTAAERGGVKLAPVARTRRDDIH